MLLLDVDGWTKVASIAGAVAAIAGLIATAAAAFALRYASNAVGEARRLRREGARDRVLDCIARHVATLDRVRGSDTVTNRSAETATRIRLEAAVDATGDHLPACREFAAQSINLTSGPVVVASKAKAALEEVAALTNDARRWRSFPSTPDASVVYPG
jgi:hypothetical protein